MARKIHIDLGAYLGESVAKFLAQHNHANDFDIYAFEPHPNNYIKLVENIGTWKGVNCINAAAGIQDCNKTLYVSGSDVCQRASEFAGKIKNEVGQASPVDIEVIDFCNWLKGISSPEDYISIGMNIEGAEYDILEAIVKNGLLDRIDTMEVKLHEQKIPNPTIKNVMVGKRLEFLKALRVYEFWVQTATKYRTKNGKEYMSDMVLQICRIR